MSENNTRVRKSWTIYLFLTVFSLVGLLLDAKLLVNFYYEFLAVSDKFLYCAQVAVYIVIVSLCRSLQLPTRKGQGMDISIIPLYACILFLGMNATAFIITVSVFFTFIRLEEKHISHAFNTPVEKTLFNTVNLLVPTYLGWLAYSGTGGVLRDLTLPGVILPSIFFLVVLLVANSVCMTILLMLMNGAPFRRTFMGGIASLLPTLMALAPIGYFIAMLSEQENGLYLVFLFFVPLMFARYAFKLYLDSKEQYFRTISTLTAAIEAKDEYTEGHSRRVEQYSVQIARELGMPQNTIENIKVAAVLHDIGKIGIDDDILRKPSFLTDEEWAKIKMHPDIGIKILEEVTMPQAVKQMIHYHHIRYDRKGYPALDSRTPLPVEVHIISLADAYDAMTSDRPYRVALTDEIALGIIREQRGKQFHPDVVDAFLRMKQKEKQAAQ